MMQEETGLTNALELRNVRKDYNNFNAVKGVSLILRKGEFLTFLGPSGSGKTTTLALVSGLQEPTSGDILLNGRPIGPLPPYKRNIGMVFQHYALFPHMTVAQNVAFPLQMRNMVRSDIDMRVAKAIAMVGLKGFGHRYPGQLSGGQQQRVALARATVFEPPLLLMDEPLGALDRNLREQMQLEIKRIHKSLGVSVLYVTHDQEEALVLSDRIAVFNNGQIEQIGTPQEIYDRPATAFVGGFLGESNFLKGTVDTVDEEFCTLVTAYGLIRSFNTMKLPSGTAAMLMIRPEQIRITRPGGPLLDNSVTGRIVGAIYLGRAIRFQVALPDGKLISVVHDREQDENFPGREGDEITLGWRAATTNVLHLPGKK